MSKPVYFVDANIIMYAVGAQHPFKMPCAQIITDIGNRLIDSVTSVEVLQEILHRYTALKRRADAVSVTHDFVLLVTKVLPITIAEVERALQLHQQYVSLTARDSIHAATLYNHGLSHILTADTHFDGLPGITRVDPNDWQQIRPRSPVFGS
jgi:hypothetical protein